MLNTYTADDDHNSPFMWVKVCFYFRIAGMILICVTPILILVPFYLIKRDQWSQEVFKKAYGAYLEGTRVEIRQ